MFAILFFLPDASFIAYLAGLKVGAFVYNSFHGYLGPVVMTVILLLGSKPLALPLIWAAHIGFDRMLGYGLKYPDSFGHTHLGKLGKIPHVSFTSRERSR